MLKIDDFFVMNEIDKTDLDKMIEKYKYFKKAGIPKKYLTEHFNALLQDENARMMFKKNNITNDYLQEFWTLRFIDIAETDFNSINNRYSSFSKEDLKKIVEISINDDRISQARKYLVTKGIILHFIDSLPGTKIDGAVYLTSNSTIAVGLTGRFKRLDYLWFALLHELSHIILHYQSLEIGIISLENSREKIEIEANRMAREAIISPEKYRTCPKRTFKSNELIKYANNNNIHPALLAGIIRRDLNNYYIFSDIIEKYKIKEEDLHG